MKETKEQGAAASVHRHARAATALGWLGALLTLFAGYLYAERYVNQNADGAGTIFEGQAMLHGNPLLHGWYAAPDPYNTTEALLDAVGSLFFTGEQLLKVTPAFLCAATVLTAAYLATRCVPAPANSATRRLAIGACLALGALPIGPLFPMMLLGSLHMGTFCACLLALVAYDRYVRQPTHWAPLGLFVLAAALAIIGDPMAEAVIAAPVAITSVCALWRTRGRERAPGAPPLSTALHSRAMRAALRAVPTPALTLAAAALALLLGLGARRLLLLAGMDMGPTTIRLASPTLIQRHLQWLPGGFCALFHLNPWPRVGAGQPGVLVALNSGFFLVGLAGFALLARRSLFPRTARDSLSGVVSWGIICVTGAFVFTQFATERGGLRYLLPAFIYAGILCYAALSQVIARRYQLPYVLAFAAASALAFGLMLAHARPASAPEQPLIAFLRGHGLTVGLGTYWDANITTLRSSGQVRVLPVQGLGGRIRPYYWVVDGAWFGTGEPRGARFIVTDELANLAAFRAAVLATFGAPDHVYHVRRYVIFAWDRPLRGTLGPPIIAR